MRDVTGGVTRDFSAILAAEKAYLAARRELGGLKPPALGAPGEHRPIGVALSGGGIRSATFNLGFLQALSNLHILPRIDYLCTVSGGGYIGSCLTSLLSRRKVAQDPRDAWEHLSSMQGNDAYIIDPATQTANFGTEPASFPFNAESNQQPALGVFNGRAQVRHLRTHGDFTIPRQLFSRDMLRALGNVLGGLFYHLLMFALFLVGTAAIYLAIVCAIVGDVRQRVVPLEFPKFVATLIEWPGLSGLGSYPLTWAFVTGALVTYLSLLLGGFALRRLPDRWFFVDGLSVEDTREIRSLWIQLVCTAVTAAALTWWYVGRAPGHHSLRLVFLLLPLGVYLGGQVSALFLHAVIAMLVTATRNDRSRFAAIHGMLNYLLAASLLFALLPWFIYWLPGSTLGIPTGGGWIVSLLGTSFLAGKGKAGAESNAAGWIRTIFRLSASLRNALLSVLVVLVLVSGVGLASSGLLVLGDRLQVPLSLLSLVTGAGALTLFSVLGVVLDFNKLSLHYFYRDRLVETYLQTYAPEAGRDYTGPELRLRDDAEMPLTHLHGCRLDPSGAPLPDCVTAAPLHLLVASLNLTASRDMTRRDRKSDQFIFSKLFCGSDTTGYVPTARYRGGRTKLARAMTISGASASSPMGRGTYFAEAFALRPFNAGHGQWIENPRYKRGIREVSNKGFVFWPFYLLRELLGSADANRRLIHLSDGGHTGDKLGIVPLLKRRCAVIVACDAEADPAYSFGPLAEARRQIYIDANIKVDIDVASLRPDAKTGLSARHFAVGKIRYPSDAQHKEEVGWLLVLKSSLTGDELVGLENYKQENPDFPQQDKADQFFDDDQFESYRELGYHVTKSSLMRMSELAWQPEAPAWERCWADLYGLPPISARHLSDLG